MKLTPEELTAAARQARKYLAPDDFARLPVCDECGGKGVKSKVIQDRMENLEIVKTRCKACAGTGKAG